MRGRTVETKGYIPSYSHHRREQLKEVNNTDQVGPDWRQEVRVCGVCSNPSSAEIFGSSETRVLAQDQAMQIDQQLRSLLLMLLKQVRDAAVLPV